MKLEVHTLRFGSHAWLETCAVTLNTWCARHRHRLRVWHDPAAWAGYPTPKFVEIDAIKSFLTGTADLFAWVDADVWVHPEAPAMPEFRGIAMATDAPHAEHQQHWEDWCEETFGERPTGHAYSNAGVYFMDRSAAERLLETVSEPFVEMFQEQHQFNWWVVKSGVEVTGLPSEWNRYGRDFEPSWFFHLWGNNKDEDLDTLRKMRLTELRPTEGLRFNIRPDAWPPSDKVVVQEFVHDAGLGNQLFEMAAGYGIAKRLGLPLRWMWRPSSKRDFGLTHFGFGEAPYIEYPLLMMRAGQGNRKLLETAVKRIEESKERFCGISCPFQAEECFSDYADEIRELFKLEPFELPNPPGTTPIGVQVRRGDYVGHSRLNVTTPDYFINAMEWMREQVENPQFIVVSDDPSYCKTIFRAMSDVTVMPPQEPIDGLRTLASCEAHIISNSTFGWWGAWLGEKGPVCVPEIWHHKPGSYGDWEPAPLRWQRIGIRPKGAPPLFEERLPKLPDPVSERAIVYPWHSGQATWEELRYSLRSIEKFFEDKHCPIYILATSRPHWLVEGKGGRVKYIGAYTYKEALAKGTHLAEKVLWMNDDIWFLRPGTWADCEVPRYLRDIGPEFLQKAQEQTNPWRRGVVQVLKRLAGMGKTEQKVFSTHTPYVFEREKVRDVFSKFETWEKFPMEMAYFHLHGKDPQLLGDLRVHELPFGDALWLNCADRHLTPAVKAALMELLPDPAPWEADVSC